MSKSLFRDYNIYTRSLILGLLPAAVTFVALVTFFTHARLEEAARDQQLRGQLIADQLAPALEYDVLTGNQRGIQRLADNVVSNPWVDSVTVYDLFGEELLRVDSGKPRDLSPMTKPSIFSANILQGTVELENPFGWSSELGLVSRQPVRLGKVEVVLDDGPLQDSQDAIISQSLSVAALLILLIVILVRSMASRMARPIQQLTRQVEGLTRREYEIPELNTRISEVRTLGHSVEVLAQTLEQHESEQTATMHQLAQSREQAEEANQAKSEFLAMMNHELKTPVNGILGLLNLMSDSELDRRQKKLLESARHAGDKLNTLVLDILDFSNLENQQFHLQPEESDPINLLRSVLDQYEPQADAKSLPLTLEADEEIAKEAIWIDPVRFQQIARHLVDNAIKFTESGQVTVALRRLPADESSDSHIELTVTDTGTGMTDAQKARIFEPFQPGDSRANRRFEGAGLGLALVSQLVRIMHGEVTVDSEYGKGTRFSVRLPCPKKPRPQGRRLAGQVALVVEDNPVNMSITVAYLEKLGLSCDQSFSGIDALARWRNRRYDVILMDCQMPIKDGYETTREIRTLEGTGHHTPIIALTANTEPGSEAECLAAGMDDFLAKPLRRKALQSKLLQWLGS